MCCNCTALKAMRETEDYETKDGKLYFILGVGEGESLKPAKFQIRRDGYLWKDKWIETDDLAGSMADLGADVNTSSRVAENWEYFQECLVALGVENDEPK